MATPGEQWPELYDELRRVASAKLAGEKPGQTLDATGLVHEAWLKLADASIQWNDRAHFVRTAATAMRRILVDRARAKLADKRDGGIPVRLADIPAPLPDADLIALDDALERMAALKPDHAKLVELRFFGGMTGDEAANALNISPATADRMWRYTRAWLQVELVGPPGSRKHASVTAGPGGALGVPGADVAGARDRASGVPEPAGGAGADPRR
jgi:RNA polymerase sigma factor (TIGR02999 family)